VKKQWPARSSLTKALPRASLSDQRKWWRFYLSQYSDVDKRPTARQQQADANAHFAELGRRGPTVEQMRELRSDPNTPPDWKVAGRRPKSR